jgi:hypothetical protein
MKFFNKRLLLIILPILFLFLTIGVFLNFSKSENLNYLNLFRNISKENPELETQKIVEIKTNPTKKLVFLMYHYVEINKNKDDFKRDSLNTLPEIFEKQILTLKEAGYKFIFPSEIYQFLRDDSNQ